MLDLTKKFMTISVLAGMILVVGAQSSAQEQDGQRKRTTVDFEDELIEGEAQKPELFYLLQKKQFNFKKLIRIRENFLPEMRTTSHEIQRQGSTD